LGLIEGPTVLSCSRIISATSPGGRIFGPMYREADGSDDMRRAVREQLRNGADFIKFMATGARSVVRENPELAQMTLPEAEAIVDEAHRMGVRVTAHAEGLDGVRLALTAGVDCLEHGLSLHRDPQLLDQMAASGTALVPTLTTFHELSERFTTVYAPVLVEQAKRQKEEAYLTLEAARRAGVILAMGYDSGPPGTNAKELVRLVEAGCRHSRGLPPPRADRRMRSACQTRWERSSAESEPMSSSSTAIQRRTSTCSLVREPCGSSSRIANRWPGAAFAPLSGRRLAMSSKR
jgi:imidazolonepropionase-like amidohydrolase